jgi:4-amino-4-deoxy-L-arabinose transferase-like glycosyltransferase
MRSSKYSWALDLAFLTITLGCLFFALLGARPLFAPDEGRYAEIAREMLMQNDFITPHLNDIKYFEKPALFYWLAAGSMKMFGLNIWSVRCVNAVLAILGALATYTTARIIYGRLTGLLAAYILSTSLLYFIMAHMVSLDLTVSVFLAMCLYSFLLSSRYEAGGCRRSLTWLSAAMAACAVLTKGLIGVVFPGMIITLWLCMTGEWRKLKQYYLPSSFIIFLVIVLPWHVAVSLQNPEFFHFYFIEQQFHRYTMMNIGHYQPAWFFIPCLLAGFFPWMIFLPTALLHQRRNRNNQFFLLWAILIFCFFSFSKSKLIPYILPIFPALAILIAHYLAAACTRNTDRGIKYSLFLLILLSIGISYLLYCFISTASLPDKPSAITLLSVACSALITGAISAWLTCNKHLRTALASIIGSSFVFLLFLIASIPSIDSRTVLPLATKIKSVIKPEDEVITYNQYFQDLPFYLERRITILNWRNEMSFGMEHQDAHDWMINNTEFWARWNGGKRIFVVMSKEEFAIWQKMYPKSTFYLLSETPTNVLLCNQLVQ